MASRLKIALLSRWLWEENRRLESHGTTQQLAEAVAALGHEVVILSQSPSTKKLERAQSLGSLETWLSPREKRRPGWIGLRDKISKQRFGHRKVHSDALDLRDFLAQRSPFDLLWAQTEEPDGLVAAIAAQRGISLPPLFVQIQSLRTKFSPHRTSFVEKPALSLAFAQATRIIANSPLVAKIIAQHYQSSFAPPLQNKTVTIYPNLTHNFLQAAATSTVTEPEKNRILFLGALNELKGALPFLAATILSHPPPHTTFAIAGDFTENNSAFAHRWHTAVRETRTELNLRFPNVQLELLGKITATQVIHEIERACVVVLPSRFDAFSRALAEALVLGRPVITSDQVGAAPLLFPKDAARPLDGAAGWIVPPENPRALGAAIAEALRSDAPQLENARHLAPHIRTLLAPQTIAQHLVATFRDVVG